MVCPAQRYVHRRGTNRGKVNATATARYKECAASPAQLLLRRPARRYESQQPRAKCKRPMCACAGEKRDGESSASARDGTQPQRRANRSGRKDGRRSATPPQRSGHNACSPPPAGTQITTGLRAERGAVRAGATYGHRSCIFAAAGSSPPPPPPPPPPPTPSRRVWGGRLFRRRPLPAPQDVAVPAHPASPAAPIPQTTPLVPARRCGASRRRACRVGRRRGSAAAAAAPTATATSTVPWRRHGSDGSHTTPRRRRRGDAIRGRRRRDPPARRRLQRASANHAAAA